MQTAEDLSSSLLSARTVAPLVWDYPQALLWDTGVVHASDVSVLCKNVLNLPMESSRSEGRTSNTDFGC